ncbi:helix-turn-helix transcriptional regulator [Loktanella agnita]|uniref:helix-turn-helix transcriptional regulator n=1 Tax=Loktanella agnita TaxID=287097 RepID=UPI003987FBE8
MEDRLLTVGQVADVMGCGQSTVWRLLRQGRFLEPKRIGGMTRWLESELLFYIRNASKPSIVGASERSTRKRSITVKKRRSRRGRTSFSPKLSA